MDTYSPTPTQGLFTHGYILTHTYTRTIYTWIHTHPHLHKEAHTRASVSPPSPTQVHITVSELPTFSKNSLPLTLSLSSCPIKHVNNLFPTVGLHNVRSGHHSVEHDGETPLLHQESSRPPGKCSLSRTVEA